MTISVSLQLNDAMQSSEPLQENLAAKEFYELFWRKHIDDVDYGIRNYMDINNYFFILCFLVSLFKLLNSDAGG